MKKVRARSVKLKMSSPYGKVGTRTAFLTKDKIAELRRRMERHGQLGDVAVVVLTARELQELLDAAEGIERDARGEVKKKSKKKNDPELEREYKRGSDPEVGYTG